MINYSSSDPSATQTAEPDPERARKDAWRRTCQTCLRVMPDDALRFSFVMQSGYDGPLVAESPCCGSCAARLNLTRRAVDLYGHFIEEAVVDLGAIVTPPMLRPSFARDEIRLVIDNHDVPATITIPREAVPALITALTAMPTGNCTITRCTRPATTTVVDMPFCDEHTPAPPPTPEPGATP